MVKAELLSEKNKLFCIISVIFASELAMAYLFYAIFSFFYQILFFRMKIFLLLLASLFFPFLGIAQKKLNYLSHTKTAQEIEAIENKMDRLFYTLCGEFNNKNQADTAQNPLLSVNQDIIAVPIWQERAGERWIYMAWFKHAAPERALTHAIFKLSKESRDTFKLTAYVIPNEEENNFYAYEWQQKKPFNSLKPKDLTHFDNCYNFIVANPQGGFEILPNPDLCSLQPSGNLHFISFSATLQTDFIYHYTSYFDKNKQKVFGYARHEGFRLERLDKNKPTYEKVKKQKTRY